MDITFSPWLIWFLAGIGIMLAELAVPGFVIIFFGLGCMGGAVVAFFFPEAYSAQVAAFLIVSIASLLTLRKLAMNIFVGRSESGEGEYSGNVLVGTRITLQQDLEAGRIGRVQFRGTMWDAISEDRIPAGSDVEITGVDQTNRSCLKIKKV
jgi:membrane protein implicated in regulation of membrane protease activity